MAQRRAKGVLKVTRRKAVAALKRAKLMEKGLEDHTGTFPNPNPALPAFSAQIVTTDKAQVVAGNGGKGVAATRNVQLGLLVGMMESELVYIQSIADGGNPDEAVSTLQAGGVAVAAVGQRNKAILTVTKGPAPGSVVLEANIGVLLSGKRGRKHFLNWQYTTDGKTFISLPSTPDGMTTATGLTPLTVVGFRVSATMMKGVTSAWSPVVEFTVQ